MNELCSGVTMQDSVLQESQKSWTEVVERLTANMVGRGLEEQVFIAVENLGGGGAERVALDLARNWPKDHAQPVLIVASRKGEYVSSLPRDLEVLEIGIPTSPRKTFSFLLRLRKLIERRKVAGVISHMTGMNRMMLRAKALGIIRAPILVVEHCNFIAETAIEDMPAWRRTALRSEISWLYRRADRVIGVSQGVTGQIGRFFSLDRRKLATILNPITPSVLDTDRDTEALVERMRNLPRPWIVSVGRMVPQKRFDDVIRAFARLKSGTLILLGEGRERVELTKLADSLGVERRVFMPGFVGSPGQVMRSADLYVSASAQEGLPLVLLEAYACGLPVVARDCDFGPAEIVTPDRPGRLVRSDSIAALTEAMEHTLSTEPRFPPGTRVDLSQHEISLVAERYRGLIDEHG